MTKIALVENRISRQQQFTTRPLDDFKSLVWITGELFNQFKAELNAGDAAQLNSYGCLMIHLTALSVGERDIVKAHCREKRKPLVFFSGSITASNQISVDFPFLNINSKDFYSDHLSMFLQEADDSKEINLALLQFGTSWRFNILLDVRDRVNQLLQQGLIRRLIQFNLPTKLANELASELDLSWLTGNELTEVSIEMAEIFYKKLGNYLEESI